MTGPELLELCRKVIPEYDFQIETLKGCPGYDEGEFEPMEVLAWLLKNLPRAA